MDANLELNPILFNEAYSKESVASLMAQSYHGLDWHTVGYMTAEHNSEIVKCPLVVAILDVLLHWAATLKAQ